MRAEHRGLASRRREATGSALRVACLAVLGVLLAGTARAESSDPDETERWVPSLALQSGVVWQDADGTLSSGTIDPDDPDAGTPQEGSKIRPDASDDDRMITPFIGGSVELMTPAFAESPGRPRLFVHGDAAAAFSFDRAIAGEGSPDDFALPDSFFLTQGDTIDEISVVGQGSRTQAEVQTLLLGAGAGVAFTVDVAGRRVRVKPSFEYLREEIEVKGVVNRAVANATEPMTLDDFRLISLTDDATETFHGIGPGLEIEGDAARLGPLVLSVYASGKAWHFLGDLDVALSAENEFGETASWTFEKERWAYGFGVGLRFRWVPE